MIKLSICGQMTLYHKRILQLHSPSKLVGQFVDVSASFTFFFFHAWDLSYDLHPGPCGLPRVDNPLVKERQFPLCLKTTMHRKEEWGESRQIKKGLQWEKWVTKKRMFYFLFWQESHQLDWPNFVTLTSIRVLSPPGSIAHLSDHGIS